MTVPYRQFATRIVPPAVLGALLQHLEPTAFFCCCVILVSPAYGQSRTGESGIIKFVKLASDETAGDHNTSAATVKIESDGARLFFREKDSTEYTKPGPRLVDSMSGRAQVVSMKVRTWTFSPDGNLVAVGWGGTSPYRPSQPNTDGAIEVWSVDSGKMVDALRGGRGVGMVHKLKFSDDGKTVFYDADHWFIDGP